MASFRSEPKYGAMSRDFQSFAGPGDRDLPMSEISGYQPISRIGEIVMNSFGAGRSACALHAPCVRARHR